MKKFTIGLLISLISLSSFACEIDSSGRCGDVAFFKTKNFDVNSIFQIRVQTGDTTYEFEHLTGWVDTDTLFSVKLYGNTPAEVQFRYRSLDSTDASYNPWGTLSNPGNWVVSSINNTCGLLPVTFESFNMQRIDQANIKFQFKSNIYAIYYRMLVSEDAKNWKELTKIAPNNSGEYSGKLSLVTGALSFGLLLLSFCGFQEDQRKPNQRRSKIILIIALFFFVACKKEIQQKQPNYKYGKIEAITGAGVISSEVKSF